MPCTHMTDAPNWGARSHRRMFDSVQTITIRAPDVGNAVRVSYLRTLPRFPLLDHQDRAAENISPFEALMNRQCRLGVEWTPLRHEGPDVSTRRQLKGFVHLLPRAVTAAHDLQFLGKQFTPERLKGRGTTPAAKGDQPPTRAERLDTVRQRLGRRDEVHHHVYPVAACEVEQCLGHLAIRGVHRRVGADLATLVELLVRHV